MGWFTRSSSKPTHRTRLTLESMDERVVPDAAPVADPQALLAVSKAHQAFIQAASTNLPAIAANPNLRTGVGAGLESIAEQSRGLKAQAQQTIVREHEEVFAIFREIDATVYSKEELLQRELQRQLDQVTARLPGQVIDLGKVVQQAQQSRQHTVAQAEAQRRAAVIQFQRDVDAAVKAMIQAAQNEAAAAGTGARLNQIPSGVPGVDPNRLAAQIAQALANQPAAVQQAVLTEISKNPELSKLVQQNPGLLRDQANVNTIVEMHLRRLQGPQVTPRATPTPAPSTPSPGYTPPVTRPDSARHPGGHFEPHPFIPGQQIWIYD